MTCLPRGCNRLKRAEHRQIAAGARLAAIRLWGRWKPELTMARSTRCVLSLTAASGSPTSTCFGSPLGETSTSTSTGKASMPTNEKVLSVASMSKSPLPPGEG